MAELLRFTSPQSSFNPSFWETLYQRKLNLYKLSDQEVELKSKIISGSDLESGNCYFSDKSFSENEDLIVRGFMRNTNSIEEFTDFNKKSCLEELALKIWRSITSGEAIKDPSKLSQFLLLSYADLKSYKFIYWFCSPAIVPADPFKLSRIVPLNQSSTLSNTGGSPFVEAIYHELLQNPSKFNFSAVVLSERSGGSSSFRFLSLTEAWSLRYDESCYFLFLDQSNTMDSLGWAIRNFLLLLFGKSANEMK
jgi:ubiquitin-like modifier-activating enzyme ATG7